MNKKGCCPVQGDMMDKNNKEIDASLKRTEESVPGLGATRQNV